MARHRTFAPSLPPWLLSALILLASAHHALCEPLPLAGLQPFHDGLVALQDHDPHTAALKFEQALQEAGPSPEIFYNLGLAYQAAGQPNQAALAFARSFFLAPGNPRIAKIAHELSQFSGATSPWDAPLLDQHRKTGPDALYAVSAALAWAGILLLVLAFTRPHSRTALLGGATTSLLVSLTLFVMTFRADPLASMRNWAVVFPKHSSHTIPLRAVPLETAASPERLEAGSFVKIQLERAGWVYCQTLRGTSGWLPTTQVIPVIPPQTSREN